MISKLSLILFAFLFAACSKEQVDNALTYLCTVDTEVTGRINYTGTVPPDPSAPIVIQYSTDNFATAPTALVVVTNLQGLLTFTFNASSTIAAGCPQTVGTVFKFRAFQDSNANGIWDSGEGSGRDDGTSDGNTTVISHAVHSNYLSATDIVIYLDSASGQ
jgi:hypothetical protein